MASTLVSRIRMAAWAGRPGARHRALALAAVLLFSVSCGEVARTGRSSAFLIISSLEAASGADPSRSGSVLNSDVETLVESTVDGQTVRVPTVFNDPASVVFRVELKNPLQPTAPGSINDITVTRYHVDYRRADGRNTPGVDVPYGFDGAFTVTVPLNGSAEAGFDLVRHQAKREPPLSNIRGGGGARLLSVIAEVTFYGRDQAGNEVSVTGSMNINFADFGDPS
jgi:hypothetical protein